MRILLDHCIDWRLKRSLPTHHVRSAQEMGWDALKNGKLLDVAASLFDAILTVDQNIKHQQNLNQLPIAIVVLIAASNRTSDLQLLLPAVERILPSLRSGALVEIDAMQNATVIAAGRA
jgi:predicted nuclease of predicted toxin-antitoxin system